MLAGDEALLVGIERGEIFDVARVQVRDLRRHDRVLARARLVVLQRFQQVVVVLAREPRKIGGRAVAVGSVARRAGARFFLAGFRVPACAFAAARPSTSAVNRIFIILSFAIPAISKPIAPARSNRTPRDPPCPGRSGSRRSRASKDACARPTCTPAALSRCKPRAGRRASARYRRTESGLVSGDVVTADAHRGLVAARFGIAFHLGGGGPCRRNHERRVYETELVDAFMSVGGSKCREVDARLYRKSRARCCALPHHR